MKLVVVTLLLTLLTMILSGQKMIPLWDSVPPYNKPGVVENERWEGNNVSNISTPTLYHYPGTAPANEPKPAVVIFPGGGYARLAFDHEGVMAAKWFAQRGFEAFVLKYRLPDPALNHNSSFVPLMDGQQAIHHVRSNAAKYNINPAKVGIIGFSAGGHLAGSVATLFHTPVNKALNPENARPDFSILVYPVITMTGTNTHAGSKSRLLGENPSEELTKLFSLENQVTERVPPTLLFHSYDDKSVLPINSFIFGQSLAAAGVDVTKIILPSGGHGYGFRPESPAAVWIQHLETWLQAKNFKY